MRTLSLNCALVALVLATPTAQAPLRPNIVMVIMDDLGYGDVGSYGAPDAKTPNIDRLAREGVKFTDFYANHSDCSPTRTAFITGRYQQRYGIESALKYGDPRHLPPSDTSLPRLLKNAGYATGLIGKWHLGTEAAAGRIVTDSTSSGDFDARPSTTTRTTWRRLRR
jgi:arylsulfatase A-like enzyme